MGLATGRRYRAELLGTYAGAPLCGALTIFPQPLTSGDQPILVYPRAIGGGTANNKWYDATSHTLKNPSDFAWSADWTTTAANYALVVASALARDNQFGIMSMTKDVPGPHWPGRPFGPAQVGSTHVLSDSTVAALPNGQFNSPFRAIDFSDAPTSTVQLIVASSFWKWNDAGKL